MYFMNDLYPVQRSPGYTCNIASGLVTWSTVVVSKGSSETIPDQQSGENVCVSYGIPHGSDPAPGVPYKGPYLVQNNKKGVLVEQTWTPSPLSSEFWTGKSQTLAPGQSWSDPDDAGHLSFTRGPDRSGAPQLTVTIPAS